MFQGYFRSMSPIKYRFSETENSEQVTSDCSSRMTGRLSAVEPDTRMPQLGATYSARWALDTYFRRTTMGP